MKKITLILAFVLFSIISFTQTAGIPKVTDTSVYQNQRVPFVNHSLQLDEGWSGMSSYLDPADPDIENMMSAIENQLIILRDFDGNIYQVPDQNTIINWDYSKGYFVKMSSPSSLDIVGLEPMSRQIDLQAGWNLVPVLSGDAVTIEDYFGGKITKVEIITEVAGVQVYWPEKEIETLNLLVPGKAYLVKAEVPFVLFEVPDVFTSQVVGINSVSVIAEGNITGQGSSPVTTRGFVWSLVQNPTMNSNEGFTVNGSGTGVFTGYFSGLSPATTYYLRAYATNINGTALGEQLIFTTSDTPTGPQLTLDMTNLEIVISNQGDISTQTIYVRNTGNQPLNFSLTTQSGSSWLSFSPSFGNINPGDFLSLLITCNSNGFGCGKYHDKLIFNSNDPGNPHELGINFTAAYDGCLPIVVTNELTEVSFYSATISGTVTDDGGVPVYPRGFVWGRDYEPTLEANEGFSNNGYGLGDFSEEMKDLIPFTTYHVRAYASNGTGTVYGEQISFQPAVLGASIPNVITMGVDEITAFTAKGGGFIDFDGYSEVLSRGVVWSEEYDPTLENNENMTTDGTGDGFFTSDLTGLTPSTTYYVRAYATNAMGTGYGQNVQFETLGIYPPSVITSSVTDISISGAFCSGNVLDDGNDPYTIRGFVWGTTDNPTLIENEGVIHDDTTGEGFYTIPVNGLNSGTIYHIRAFAVNTVDTAYGNSIEFQTLYDKTCPGMPTVTDPRDGKVYLTVQIGNQCWMRSNLNIGIQIIGSANQTNNNTIEKYCYNNEESNCGIYGGLYQWSEMMNYSYTANYHQGICMDGWHLPGEWEWNNLISFLGGANIAAPKLKETGTAHWNPPNSAATNSSGFTALPGGSRFYFDFGFYNLKGTAHFWAATQTSVNDGKFFYLQDWSSRVYNSNVNKLDGKSVRCIKNP